MKKITIAIVAATLLAAAIVALFLTPNAAVFAGLWVAGLLSTVVFFRLQRQGRTVSYASKTAKYL